MGGGFFYLNGSWNDGFVSSFYILFKLTVVSPPSMCNGIHRTILPVDLNYLENKFCPYWTCTNFSPSHCCLIQWWLFLYRLQCVHSCRVCRNHSKHKGSYAEVVSKRCIIFVGLEHPQIWVSNGFRMCYLHDRKAFFSTCLPHKALWEEDICFPQFQL